MCEHSRTAAGHRPVLPPRRAGGPAMAPPAARSLRCRFPTFLGLFQGALLLFFALGVSYDEHTDAALEAAGADPGANELYGVFPFFQDVQALLAVALGLLLAFMPRYGLGALAFSFLLLNFSTQWALLLRGLLYHRRGGRVRLGLRNVLEAEFAATAVLISAGAVLGRTSPLQLLVAALCEVPVFLASEWAILTGLKVLDVGGTITIHVFACYFGLAMSWALFRGRKAQQDCAAAKPTRPSDTVSLVGMLSLWVFWPSFVAALSAPGAAQHRAVLHTVLALSAGALTAALASGARRGGRLSPAHLQNASLAGGVAVGALADLPVTPGAALALGSVAALTCVLGAERAAPALARRLGLLDQCGIHSLHGLPGIVGAAASAAAVLAEGTSGQRFQEQFPVAGNASAAGGGAGRSGAEQALAQAAGLAVALGSSLLGGSLTGALLRLPVLVPPARCADDALYFEVHGEDGAAEAAGPDEDAGVALKERA